MAVKLPFGGQLQAHNEEFFTDLYVNFFHFLLFAPLPSP